MTTEPRLFTEAEADALCRNAFSAEIMAELRERGLIADEPVDPLLEPMREIAAMHFSAHRDDDTASDIEEGVYDGEADDISTVPGVAMFALRRGMELAPRKELTREMVRSALLAAQYYPSEAERFVDRLHAALTEALQ